MEERMEMEQEAPQEAPQGNTDALDGMQQIGTALQSLLQGGEQAGMPPEALQALQAASEAYNEFLSIITGGEQAQGTAQMDAAGNPGAVPMR